MDARIDSVAADGIMSLSNEAYRKGDKAKCERLQPFMRVMFTNAKPSEVGRSEATIPDVLRAFAAEIEKFQGDMTNFSDTHFLEEVCAGLGKALKDGLSVAANSARICKECPNVKN
jgi:hypothetical protein